jgi:putative oxidoreductase
MELSPSSLSQNDRNSFLLFCAVFWFCFTVFQLSAIFWPSEWVAAMGGPATLQINQPILYFVACAFVSAITALFGLYDLSGAGYFRRLPLLRVALIVVTALLLRGLAAIQDWILIQQYPEKNLYPFLAMSLAALCIGVIHLAGMLRFLRRERKPSVAT